MLSEKNELVVEVSLTNYETQEYRMWVNFRGIAADSGNAYFGEEGKIQASRDARVVFDVLNSVAPYFELQK
jgi:hypothetical protein